MVRFDMGRGMQIELPFVCEACGTDEHIRGLEAERNIMNRSVDCLVECHGRRTIISITYEFLEEARHLRTPLYAFGGEEERRFSRQFRSLQRQGRAIINSWERIPGLNVVDEYIMEREGPIRIPAEARIDQDSLGESFVRPDRQVRPPPEPPREPFVLKRRLRLRPSNVDQAPSHPATEATGTPARLRRRPPTR